MDAIINRLEAIKEEYNRIQNKDVETIDVYFKLTNGSTLNCRYEFLLIDESKKAITLLLGWQKIQEQKIIAFADIQCIYFFLKKQIDFINFDSCSC